MSVIFISRLEGGWKIRSPYRPAYTVGRARIPKCSECGAPLASPDLRPYLGTQAFCCDFPETASKTFCTKPLCGTCRVSRPGGLDVCPQHKKVLDEMNAHAVRQE